MRAGGSVKEMVDEFAALSISAEIEQLLILYMGDDCYPYGQRLAPPGNKHQVAIPMRHIVQEALELNCRGIVLAHNHPSGDARPSRGDIDSTRLLASTLKPLGIRVDEHFIIAKDELFSFRGQGLV